MKDSIMNPIDHRWTLDLRKLQYWFLAYVIVWGLDLYAIFTSTSPDFSQGIYVIVVLCIVLYVVCIVYGYKIQSQLITLGLYNRGAWQVIVGAVILNPLAFGLLIPASVLLTGYRIRRKYLPPTTTADFTS